MDKLTMAHQMALAIQGAKLLHDMELVSSMAWKYADAMQAEAEKREDKERPDVLKEEWQLDWNQAPEWANYWIKTSGKMFAWLERKPSISNLTGGWNIECMKKQIAPSFDYQGNWQDSLRERPNGF